MSDKDIKKKLHNKIDEIEKYGYVVADITPDELKRLLEIASHSVNEAMDMYGNIPNHIFEKHSRSLEYFKSLQERIER